MSRLDCRRQNDKIIHSRLQLLQPQLSWVSLGWVISVQYMLLLLVAHLCGAYKVHTLSEKATGVNKLRN